MDDKQKIRDLNRQWGALSYRRVIIGVPRGINHNTRSFVGSAMLEIICNLVCKISVLYNFKGFTRTLFASFELTCTPRCHGDEL